MSVPVYFASARQNRICAEETLPAKLDLLIERLGLLDRVNKKTVAIKMHLGDNIGYSTIHPVFVRRLVRAIKDAGGQPFLTDNTGSALSAHERGYARETVGCPVMPCAGMSEREYQTFEYPFRNIKEWKMASTLLEADFLLGLAHVKGHPTCGFGAAIKNFALGACISETRGRMHDTMHFEKYWFPERLPKGVTPEKVIASCPVSGIVPDRESAGNVHLHYDNCNQCMDCQEVSCGALEIREDNFHAFQEASAISVMHTLSRFETGDRAFINIATQMTPVCDCFGFTGLSVLPDIGMFASNDILAVEQATLDEIGKCRIIEENLPLSMIPQHGEGYHPFQVLHGPYKDPYKAIEYGEKLGIGSSDYEMIDVMPLEAARRAAGDLHVSAGER